MLLALPRVSCMHPVMYGVLYCVNPHFLAGALQALPGLVLCPCSGPCIVTMMQ
mgnify:CR=1 FL=1